MILERRRQGMPTSMEPKSLMKMDSISFSRPKVQKKSHNLSLTSQNQPKEKERLLLHLQQSKYIAYGFESSRYWQSFRTRSPGTHEQSDNMLWTEKYRPTTIKEIIGNKELVRKISAWLEMWYVTFYISDSNDTNVMVLGRNIVTRISKHQLTLMEASIKLVPYY